MIKDSQSRILSNRDRDLVLSLLDNPPKPNSTLKKMLLNAARMACQYKSESEQKKGETKLTNMNRYEPFIQSIQLFFFVILLGVILMYPNSSSAEMNHLITHHDSPKKFDVVVSEIKQRILQKGDKNDTTVTEQLKLVDELTTFGFGRFLLENRGINGFWTQHMVLWPKRQAKNKPLKIPIPSLERWLLEEAPIIQATQERFMHFQRILQDSLTNNTTLASLPCGMMDDLLTLDFSKTPNVKLVGIDLDQGSIEGAKASAQALNLANKTSFIQVDAWKLNLENQYDILTSNGLNIYEPDDNKVLELYKNFYSALKPNGILITSFLTPPPALNPNSPWSMAQMDPENLRRQKIIFSYILDAKWQAFRTEEQTLKQLKQAGFKDIEIIYDRNKLFPTVIAKK